MQIFAFGGTVISAVHNPPNIHGTRISRYSGWPGPTTSVGVMGRQFVTRIPRAGVCRASGVIVVPGHRQGQGAEEVGIAPVRVGVRADHTGSQNATRRAKEKVPARNYISRQNTIVHLGPPGQGVHSRPGAGLEAGVSDGGRPPVGGRFRQPDRTPYFRLTPAFGLRSLCNERTDTFRADSDHDFQFSRDFPRQGIFRDS